MEKVCHLLKITNSVRPTFIPGSSSYIDKQGATWWVQEVNEDGMVIKLAFDNPIYIARGELPDLFSVSFHNTEYWLIPDDERKKAIPSGFTARTEVPLQTDETLPSLDISRLKEVLFSVFVVQYLVGFTQSQLFGMIKNL